MGLLLSDGESERATLTKLSDDDDVVIIMSTVTKRSPTRSWC